MAEHKRAVRRQDKSGLVALQRLKPGRAFDKGRTTVVDSTKRKRDILRPGAQRQRVLISARPRTCATKPVRSIGDALARNYEPVVIPHFPCH